MTLTVLPGGVGSLPPEDDSWRVGLKMKNKEIASIPHNAYVFFRQHPAFKGHVRWNKVTLKVEITGGSLKSCPNPDNFDVVVTRAQDYLASTHELSLGRDDIGRRLAYVAEENAYDPLHDYLNNIVWDKKKRIGDKSTNVAPWLTTYAGAKPTADGYVDFIGRKWLVSCVARAFHPGCKADMVLVAEGDQGLFKSTLFSILGGPFYTEASGVLGDKDSKQLIGAAWICELPDMASFSRTNRNTMKAFFSSPVDRYRRPYAKDTIAVPRRCCFAATTNDEEYLGDPTGNRRFLPVLLGEVGPIDRAALIRDRDQIWAEVVAIYKAQIECEACKASDVVVPGEVGRCDEHSWWLTADQALTAKVYTQLREEIDSWGAAVLKYAASPYGIDEGGKPVTDVTTAAILINAIKRDLKDIRRDDEMRVSAILRRAGYVRGHRGRDTPWVPGPSHPDHGKKAQSMTHETVRERIADALDDTHRH